MNKFERFITGACPWLFGAVCIATSLLVASRNQPENRMLWVVLMCSGFILFTLYGIITVLLQILKVLEGKREDKAAG